MCPQEQAWAQVGNGGQQALVRGAEARARGGLVEARCLGIGGGARVRRQREPGFQLAPPVWRGGRSSYRVAIGVRDAAGDNGTSPRRPCSAQHRLRRLRQR